MMDIAQAWWQYANDEPTSVWSVALGIALVMSMLVIAFLPARWIGGAIARRVTKSGFGPESVVLLRFGGAVFIGLTLSGFVVALVREIPSAAGQQAAVIAVAGVLMCLRIRAFRRRHGMSQLNDHAECA
ncbi:hypothetical protein ACNQR7_31225 [Mycolicibacterium senegalense]